MSETLEVEVVSVAAGPGRRLAEARDAQGLALEHVAGQLRLSVHMLEALEKDDYAQLPPAAFVTGYLRSYARLLGLPEQEIVDGFTSAGKAPPPAEVGAVARSQPPQVRASDPQVRAITYLVFGGLLLLSMLWWITQRELPQPAEPAPEAVATTAETPAVDLAPTAPIPLAVEDAPSAAAAGAPVPELPAARVEIAPPAVVPEPVPEAAPVESPAPAEPLPPPLTADVPQSKLVLEFTGDCWTEITDAAGRKLIYDLAQAGRVVTLRGEAPFTVFFGYAPAAQVTLNDELFDHSPYQRRNDTARFRLGSAGDNAPRTE